MSKIFRPVPRNRIIDGTFKTRKTGQSSQNKNSSTNNPVSKQSPLVEPTFTLENGLIFSPTLNIDPVQDVFQPENRTSYWNSIFEDLIKDDK